MELDNKMDFPYGDLVVICNQCGNKQVLETMVTDGRAIYLFNKNDSYLKLKCDKCNASMEIRMEPNTEDLTESHGDRESQSSEPKNSEPIIETNNEEFPEKSPTEESI